MEIIKESLVNCELQSLKSQFRENFLEINKYLVFMDLPKLSNVYDKHRKLILVFTVFALFGNLCTRVCMQIQNTVHINSYFHLINFRFFSYMFLILGCVMKTNVSILVRVYWPSTRCKQRYLECWVSCAEENSVVVAWTIRIDTTITMITSYSDITICTNATILHCEPKVTGEGHKCAVFYRPAAVQRHAARCHWSASPSTTPKPRVT